MQVQSVAPVQLDAVMQPSQKRSDLSVLVEDTPCGGGEHSGKSDTITEALLLHSDTAAPATLEQPPASAPPEPAAAPQEPAAASPAVVQLPVLSPLPPPDASEGPEAAAEYEVYLQRWDAGDTLAQRWHRLAQKNKLESIRSDYEDWQLDLMLVDVKQKTAAAIREQGRAQGMWGGPLICSTRLRRGRGGEVAEQADDSPTEEPRRVRSRRAPSTLQDYQVDAAANAAAPVARRTPDRTPETTQQQQQANGGYRQGQLLPPVAPTGGEGSHSEESTDDAAEHVTARLQQQQAAAAAAQAAAQQQQQQQQQRPSGRRGPLPQQQPKRVVTRVQRSGSAAAAPQQQPQRQFNRVITPYNPAQLHQAHMGHMGHHMPHMQAHAAAQQMMCAVQAEQQQVAAAAAMAGISPEMLEEFYAMGARLGTAFGSGGEAAGPTGGLAQNPAAMAAFMHALYQYAGGTAPPALPQAMPSLSGQQQ